MVVVICMCGYMWVIACRQTALSWFGCCHMYVWLYVGHTMSANSAELDWLLSHVRVAIWGSYSWFGFCHMHVWLCVGHSIVRLF